MINVPGFQIIWKVLPNFIKFSLFQNCRKWKKRKKWKWGKKCKRKLSYANSSTGISCLSLIARNSRFPPFFFLVCKLFFYVFTISLGIIHLHRCIRRKQTLIGKPSIGPQSEANACACNTTSLFLSLKKNLSLPWYADLDLYAGKTKNWGSITHRQAEWVSPTRTMLHWFP